MRASGGKSSRARAQRLQGGCVGPCVEAPPDGRIITTRLADDSHVRALSATERLRRSPSVQDLRCYNVTGFRVGRGEPAGYNHSACRINLSYPVNTDRYVLMGQSTAAGRRGQSECGSLPSACYRPLLVINDYKAPKSVLMRTCNRTKSDIALSLYLGYRIYREIWVLKV